MRSLTLRALGAFVALCLIGGVAAPGTAFAQESEATPSPTPSASDSPSSSEQPTEGSPSPSPQSSSPASSQSGNEGQTQPVDESTDASQASGLSVSGTQKVCDIAEGLGIDCEVQSSMSGADVLLVSEAALASVGDICPGLECGGKIGQMVQDLLAALADVCSEGCLPDIDTGRLIETAQGLLDLVIGICPGLQCVPNIDVGPYIDTVVRIIGDACPNLSCTDRVTDLLDGLIISLCGGSALSCVDRVTQLVNDIITIYCPALQCGAQAIDTAERLVASTIAQLCGQYGVKGCADNAVAVVEDVVDRYCPGLQ